MRFHTTIFPSDNMRPRVYSSNRTPDRHRASQRRLACPLSLFDPSLRAIYVSALDAQERSRNIVACNPFTKQAEELAYPLTSAARHNTVTVTSKGIRKYMNKLRLGWCCWCSLCSERPRFAKVKGDAEGAYLSCYQCGFYVSLDKVYETSTRYVAYPQADQGALRPVTTYFIGVGEELPFKSQRTVDFEVQKHLETQVNAKETHANVKRERSPQFPSTLDEILAGIEEDTVEKILAESYSSPEKSKSKSKSKPKPYDGPRRKATGKQSDVEDYIQCSHCQKYLIGKSLKDHIFSEDCIIDVDSD